MLHNFDLQESVEMGKWDSELSLAPKRSKRSDLKAAKLSRASNIELELFVDLNRRD